MNPPLPPHSFIVDNDREAPGVVQVHSKWELVDYDEDSDEEDASGAG